jgi:hypothetical protein
VSFLSLIFDSEHPRGLRPDPVFIVGMHRSGTSALSGALEKLGLSVGKTVMPPHAQNPKGYFENLALTVSSTSAVVHGSTLGRSGGNILEVESPGAIESFCSTPWSRSLAQIGP